MRLFCAKHTHTRCRFQLYHEALPAVSGNLIFNWSDSDCRILNALQWFRPAQASAACMFQQIFDSVLSPIFASEEGVFGSVTFDDVVRLYSIVSSRSFGSRHECDLIPVFDLVNGISCGAASCHLCNHAFSLSPTEQLPLQVLETLCDIRCGQEILLEYAELPAHAFLMQYDFLPLHPAYVLSNLENHTLLHSAAFIDHLTHWRHPTNVALRQQLKDHVLTRMGMPVPFAPLGLHFEECEVASLRQASSMLFTLH
jgi:hypothetical protein